MTKNNYAQLPKALYPKGTDKADRYTAEEAQDLDKAQKATAVEAAQLLLENGRINAKERVGYASKIFYLSCVWLVIVILITIASGTPCIPFSLSDKVLITLLTTTTITILGLFATVLKFLFNSSSSNDGIAQLINSGKK